MLLRITLYIVIVLVASAKLGTGYGTWVFDYGNCGEHEQHTYKFGLKGADDRLLFTAQLRFPSKFMEVIKSDLYFPQDGDINGSSISYIEVEDKILNRKGGCAYIKDGGVGDDHVKIHFRSQRNFGMEFKVAIYGHTNAI